MSRTKNEDLSFWDHLEELRAVIVKIFVVVLVFGIIAFFFKDEVYAIILAPKDYNFVTYDFFTYVNNLILGDHNQTEPFYVDLINTGLAGQFVVHMKTSAFIAVLCVLPYILYQLFSFISPALYKTERKISGRIIVSSYVMFMLGVTLTYFLIFPLTFRFLGTYQVSEEVVNTITIQSYLGTFTMLSLAMGIVFEIPVVVWLLANYGLISAQLMRKYRRYVIVVLLILAAFITPTTDIFTLLIVALPMYLLYEVSIYLLEINDK